MEGAARAEGEHEQRLARHVVHDVRVAIDLHTDNSRVKFDALKGLLSLCSVGWCKVDI